MGNWHGGRDSYSLDVVEVNGIRYRRIDGESVPVNPVPVNHVHPAVSGERFSVSLNELDQAVLKKIFGGNRPRLKIDALSIRVDRLDAERGAWIGCTWLSAELIVKLNELMLSAEKQVAS